MIRSLSCVTLVLLTGMAVRAGELDSEFGDKAAAPQAVASPDVVASVIQGSELDQESPAQSCHFRGGWGRGWGWGGWGGGLGWGGWGGGLGWGGYGWGWNRGWGGWGGGLGWNTGWGGWGGGLGWGGYGLTIGYTTMYTPAWGCW